MYLNTRAKIMTKFITINIVLLMVLFPLPSFADKALSETSTSSSYQVNMITDKLNIPWAMAFVNQAHLLITERQGTLKLLDRFSGKLQEISGVPAVYNQGQGGLLDIALPPNYKEGDWIYFTYSKLLKNSGATTLARAKLQNNALVNWSDLLITKSTTDTGRHFGSRIAFDNNGHIFFTVGDRGVRPNGQDLSTHAGLSLIHISEPTRPY